MKIIIIGAGAAGIYAGNLLKSEGFEVEVLEARDRAGGRIATDQDFAQHPIELGAAYSHGSNHTLYELSEYMNAELEPDEGKGYYLWEGKLLSKGEARQIDELREALNVFPELYRYKGPDLPLNEVIETLDTEGKLKPIFDGLASEYGCNLGELGTASLAEEERIWDSIGGDFYFPKGLYSVFEELMKDLGASLHLSTIVTEISYNNQGVSIKCKNGQAFEADKVLITVPLSVLKARTIQFDPPLPQEKTTAIESIGIGAGMKVFLQFNKRFWPDDLQFICGGAHCPWYETVQNSPEDQPILKAYLMSSYARKLSQLSEEECIQLLLDELDDAFAEMKPSEAFVKGKRVDWGKEPYIWGAYSYASPNSLGQREVLAQPVSNKLYFAGEATNFKGAPATVHGAMESAAWAVEQMLGGEGV